jgi:pantoate kinase
MLTAANRAHNLGMDPRTIAAIAHETEVEHRTGLGDVAACQAGGRVVRTGAGIDGRIQRHFDLPEPLYAVSFGPISTPSVLGSRDQLERVARAYPPRSPLSFPDFFVLCRDFSRESGLETPDVSRTLAACAAAGVPAGMTMLGNGVFAYGRRARALLRPHGRVFCCQIALQGPRVLSEEP